MSDSVRVGECKYPKDTYRIVAWMLPEKEGGYSVVSINLPGCGTQGETLRECFDNLKEAATGLIESYLEDGREIPWASLDAQAVDQWPDCPTKKRITVFVQVTNPRGAT